MRLLPKENDPVQKIRFTLHVLSQMSDELSTWYKILQYLDNKLHPLFSKMMISSFLLSLQMFNLNFSLPISFILALKRQKQLEYHFLIYPTPNLQTFTLFSLNTTKQEFLILSRKRSQQGCWMDSSPIHQLSLTPSELNQQFLPL